MKRTIKQEMNHSSLLLELIRFSWNEKMHSPITKKRRTGRMRRLNLPFTRTERIRKRYAAIRQMLSSMSVMFRIWSISFKTFAMKSS